MSTTALAVETGATLIDMFLREMEQEAIATRRLLERVPEDKYDWKPHEKSMPLMRLVTHIAELPGWVAMTMYTDELDFAKNGYEAKIVKNNKELLAFFDETLAQGRKALKEADPALLPKDWTLRRGEKIFSIRPKSDVIRMAFCQIVHHRAQLGVYLRLLNVPLPMSYGPTADEGAL